MQEDAFPAAEKILSDIENVLRKDANLSSFEIIPAEDNENKSPVFHDENSLGLASWSVQPLYCYAYNRLLEHRRNKHRREEPGTVSRWLMGALLLNPDVSTFWNMRRELVRSGRLDALHELRFAGIVLHYKAKCFEAFAYRRWLVQLTLLGNRHPRCDDVLAMLRDEIRIAGVSADRYANNCHAWCHRQHVLTTCEALAPDDFPAMLRAEWQETAGWCDRHVSDYSGLAYRQFLLRKILGERNFRDDVTGRRELLLAFVGVGGCCDADVLRGMSCREILSALHGSAATKRPEADYERALVGLSYWAEECNLNDESINMYPGHEALWYHRRFLAHTLATLATSYEEHSCYETFQPRDGSRTRLKSDRAPSALENVLERRNRDLVANAKRQGQYQSQLADQFLQFLAGVGLETRRDAT